MWQSGQLKFKFCHYISIWKSENRFLLSSGSFKTAATSCREVFLSYILQIFFFPCPKGVEEESHPLTVCSIRIFCGWSCIKLLSITLMGNGFSQLSGNKCCGKWRLRLLVTRGDLHIFNCHIWTVPWGLHRTVGQCKLARIESVNRL